MWYRSSRRRNPSVRVKIVRAWQEDIGNRTIRIPRAVQRDLGVSTGDLVKITGPRRSLELTIVGYPLSEQRVAGIDERDRKLLGLERRDYATLSSITRSSTRSPTTWLFNYGSNYPGQLKKRLGHPIDDTAFAAYLPNYRLCFLSYSYGREGGVAGVLPKRGSEVCGYVCAVTDEDLDKLDIPEGVAGDYYHRKFLPVMKANDAGDRFERISAVVYVPGEERLNGCDCCTPPDNHYPSDEYLDAVEKTIFTFWDEDECRDSLDDALYEVS